MIYSTEEQGAQYINYMQTVPVHNAPVTALKTMSKQRDRDRNIFVLIIVYYNEAVLEVYKKSFPTPYVLGRGGSTAEIVPPETGTEEEDHAYDGHDADEDGGYDASFEPQ